MVLEITVAVGALFGMITKGNNKNLLIIGIILGVIFVSAFIAIAIGTHFIPALVFGNGDCKGSEIQWIKSGEKANNYSALFCQPTCPCDMTHYEGFSP